MPNISFVRRQSTATLKLVLMHIALIALVTMAMVTTLPVVAMNG